MASRGVERSISRADEVRCRRRKRLPSSRRRARGWGGRRACVPAFRRAARERRRLTPRPTDAFAHTTPISPAAQLRKAAEDVKRAQALTAMAKWTEKGPRVVSRARWERQARRAVEELRVASAELKERRKARLAEYYGSLEAQYEQELNDKGLAFQRERF